MSDTVFVLHHVHEFEDCGHEDTKIIGIYKTRMDAENALARVKEQPGFRDHLNGFSIDEWKLNRTGWEEGFTTLDSDDAFSK
jgi:hypothetical protein